MSRAWTPDELAVINTTTRSWVRKADKLDAELVKRIRERTDSLSIPWTAQELAAEFGVEPDYIADIARRHNWDDPVYEPADYTRD